MSDFLLDSSLRYYQLIKENKFQKYTLGLVTFMTRALECAFWLQFVRLKIINIGHFLSCCPSVSQRREIKRQPLLWKASKKFSFSSVKSQVGHFFNLGLWCSSLVSSLVSRIILLESRLEFWRPLTHNALHQLAIYPLGTLLYK